MKPIVTDDGTCTLFSERFAETYHSRYGAATESRHIFLVGSGANTRLLRRQKTRILEVGLGTGLNFLLTADLALRNQTELHYTAVEFAPITPEQFDMLGYSALLTTPALCDLFKQALDDPARTITKCANTISLTVQKRDIRETQLPTEHFDVVYLDAFSPASNAECWTPRMLRWYYSLLVDGGKLSSFSAKGSFRRALVAAGFETKKQAGPPGKREFIVASKAYYE